MDVTVEEWMYRVGRGLAVGHCPNDGGAMMGQDPIESMGRLYLDAVCVSCKYETSRPGGRQLEPRRVVPFRRRPVPVIEREADWAERAVGGR